MELIDLKATFTESTEYNLRDLSRFNEEIARRLNHYPTLMIEVKALRKSTRALFAELNTLKGMSKSE